MATAFDCIVLGGGPAGSTVAALVAEAGFSTLLLERETMPRFHVGESLMPETYWTLQRLGVLDRMKASSHPHKVSVQFVNERGKASRPFYFHDHDPRECSQTWQVVRSEFDQMLWDNAASHGAVCRQGVRAMEVCFSGSEDFRRATGVEVLTETGARDRIDGKVVVDATGQQSLIAHRLKLRRDNPEMRKSSIWTYYRGAWRGEGRDGGATVIFHTEAKRSWFWSIPLRDGLTSIGVVGDTETLLKGRGTPEAIFEEELSHCPALQSRLRDAERTEPFRVAREFSYSTDQASGNGWVLVGDAMGFVDPVYSAGVFLALKSGELAADAIADALRHDDPSAERLGSWLSDFGAGVDRVRKLVRAFYTPDFSFGRFVTAHPEHIGNLTDLLIGRIFHPEAGNIFHDMDGWLEPSDA